MLILNPHTVKIADCILPHNIIYQWSAIPGLTRKVAEISKSRRCGIPWHRPPGMCRNPDYAAVFLKRIFISGIAWVGVNAGTTLLGFPGFGSLCPLHLPIIITSSISHKPKSLHCPVCLHVCSLYLHNEKTIILMRLFS